MKFPAFIINTPGDEEFFLGVASQFKTDSRFIPQRVEGVLGRTLPNVVCQYCTYDPNSVNNKGAVGVFFAHVNAWEAIVAADCGWGLVLEDDVIISNLEKLDFDKFPAGFDVIFVNDRTAPVRNGNPATVEFAHIGHSLPAIEARKMSVGGDGYILSVEGAKKLLEAIKKDRFFSHVDLRILAYCLTPEDVAQYASTGPVSKELVDIAALVKRNQYLKGFSTYPSIATHTPVASRRVREDKIGREAKNWELS